MGLLPAFSDTNAKEKLKLNRQLPTKLKLVAKVLN